jgi:hypothetical protein
MANCFNVMNYIMFTSTELNGLGKHRITFDQISSTDVSAEVRF